MKRFAYVCADAGIPVPGIKGASIHVASVCRALGEAGLGGEVYCHRPKATDLCGHPVFPIVGPEQATNNWGGRETGLFLSSLDSRIATGRSCDFIYERYSLWHTGGLARARRLGVPFILEVNSPLPDEAKEFRGLDNQELADGIARLLLREADGIVCVSAEVAAWAAARRGHDRNVWLVPNGVDPDLFSPGEAHRPAPLPANGVPLVAFSGSFRPWHAMDDLARAFRILVEEEVPDAHLVCVGDGPLRESFEETIREFGLADRVHTPGAVPHADVAGWLRGADVAVAPYPELQNFYFSPLKIFEFLALELPVVAGDIGQIPELIPDGQRGLLYRAGDPQDMARAMARLLRNRREARRLADAGRAWVLEHATWSKRVGSILSRIESL